MKKLSLYILVCFLICAVCSACQNSNTQNSDFNYNENTTSIIITGYTGADRNAVIPEKINNKPVTSIAPEAFKDSTIESVTFPATVTTIEKSSFENCVNIKSLDIPKTVEAIGSCAFKNCTALESLKIPKSLKNIEKNSDCFSGCINLKNISFNK